MTIPRVKTKPYAWDRGKSATVPGVMLYSGTARAFIPGKDLRRIADRLHDHADHLEDQEDR